LAAAFVIAGLAPGAAHASVDLINDQGATAPCIGIGPIGGPAAEYCAKLQEENGFLRVGDVGVAGLTLGAGDQDGVIIAVAPGSPGDKAGLMVGDVIAEIDGRPVTANPGAVAAQHLFGKRGEKAKVHIRRDGVEMDLVLQRTPVAVGPAPASTNPLVAIKPLVDWRGKFIPCVAMGPIGFAAIAFCNNHFRPFGYVPVPEAAGPGFDLDMTRADRAVIKTVDADGKAAGLARPGDEILAVDGVTVAGSRTGAASTALFGRIGDQKRVIVARAGKPVAATLVLAAKPRT
jgi:C-terminal processing protease CtpA/Prc